MTSFEFYLILRFFFILFFEFILFFFSSFGYYHFFRLVTYKAVVEEGGGRERSYSQCLACRIIPIC